MHAGHVAHGGSEGATAQVHRATARDLDPLRTLCAAVTRDRAAFGGVRREPFDPTEWASGRVAAVVATVGTEPVGFAAAVPQNVPWAAPRCAELTVYVAQSSRRRGVARAAASELFTVARAMGLWKLTCCALPEDPAARALLARFEFREVGLLAKHVQVDGIWRDVTCSERLMLSARRSLPG
jgi:L-amino acid N-acyltransferase YncA